MNKYIFKPTPGINNGNNPTLNHQGMNLSAAYIQQTMDIASGRKNRPREQVKDCVEFTDVLKAEMLKDILKTMIFDSNSLGELTNGLSTEAVYKFWYELKKHQLEKKAEENLV